MPQAHLLSPGDGRFYGVVGHMYRVLVGGAQTGGRYAAVEGIIPPGDGPPPHHHVNEDEALFVIEGQIVLQIEGRQSTATPGTFVQIPKGTVHTFTNPGPLTARILLVVSPAGFEEFFAAVGVPITDPAGDPPPTTVQHIQRVVEAAPRYGCAIDMPTES